MEPKLIAITGPLKATDIPLETGEITIGRDLSNLLLLDDISVSRRHCVLRGDHGRYTLTDTDSHNGTFVNDVPIKERLLEHGDRIRVGNSVFIFLRSDCEDSQHSPEVLLTDERLVTRTEVRFRLEDELYSAARDLGVLMRACSALTSTLGLADLERGLLEQMFSVVPAERATMLLASDVSHQLTSLVALDRHLGEDNTIRVSHTVVQQALREGVSILSNDVLEGDAFGSAESLITSSIRSILCVPLVSSGKALGALYLDTSDPAARFDQGHLQMATAIANVAAGVLASARRLEWLEEENHRLRADNGLEHGMIGESARMSDVYRLIARVSAQDTTVLINGESGTGKELAARAIHSNSPRADKPFVAINCATLTETLLESELFGHEKGAFTGAIGRKKGQLEIADGGTLFLDEVGELNPSVQAKLLRVLQERAFVRVGGTQLLSVDLRVLAATNRDLREAVSSGAFRQDLYYRLNVVSLTMPPLRERRDDIPLLANYFAVKYSRKCNRKVDGFSSAARARLIRYEWPGNIRELENAVERAVVLGSTPLIQPEDLPEGVFETSAPAGFPAIRYSEAVIEAKRRIIAAALEQEGGSYTAAARLLGIHPNNLHRLIKSLHLNLDSQN
jgi:Nif-specific regulatory protein